MADITVTLTLADARTTKVALLHAFEAKATITQEHFNPVTTTFSNALHSAGENPFYQITHTI